MQIRIPDVKHTVSTKILTQDYGQVCLTLKMGEVILPHPCHCAFYLENNQVMCFGKDHVIRTINLSNMQEVSKTNIGGLNCANLYLFNKNQHALIYNRRNFNGILLNVNGLTEISSYKLNFSEINSLTKYHIGRTYQKPDALQLFSTFSSLALTNPLAKLSIKPSTKWAVLNNIVIKIPEDNRGLIKLYQIEETKDNKITFKELPSIKYVSLKSNKLLVSNIQVDADHDILTFTVHTDDKKQCKSYAINITKRAVEREFEQVELLSKLPGDVFLCIEAPNNEHGIGVTIKGRLSVWNVKTNEAYPFDKLTLADQVLNDSRPRDYFFDATNNKLIVIYSAEFKPSLTNAKTLPKSALAIELDEKEKNTSHEGNLSVSLAHHPFRFQPDTFPFDYEDADSSLSYEVEADDLTCLTQPGLKKL